jgi:FMN reductase
MSNSERPLIVGVGGTTRQNSSTEKALQVSLKAAEAQGAETLLISGPDIVLPMYAPGDMERSEKSDRLVDVFRRCDGLIIASPSYHGSISGLVKNALDYTEDLREDPRVYLDGVAVGVIACAGGWQASVQTLMALRSIIHALRGWPTPMGAALNTAQPIFDQDGQCTDLSAKFQLETVGRQVFDFAKNNSKSGS